jgi:hypothetical protein
VVLLTALLTVLPRRFPDRRFERATLRRALPVFMLYVALLALWSPDRPLVPWHGIFGLTDRITESNTHALLTRMQYLAAFSILGYLVAEWRGRAELSIAHDLPGLLTIVGGFAFLLEVLVGFQSGMGASLVRFLLVTAGAMYGGIIYHRLRDHIRFVRGHGGINS